MSTPWITVLTPTFNRAHTLPDVYESLRAQTLRDFEWLVVDDGSTDGTEALVAAWTPGAPFASRYVRQENAGKAAAVNRGFELARGQFLAVLDSDDQLVPEALATLREIWESIPPERREEFSGVTVHCRTPDGRLVGSPFPEGKLDAHPHELLGLHGVRGEKWGAHRTELLRRERYPIFPGERFVPEGLVWNRLSRRFKTRHRNVALRIYRPTSGGLAHHLDLLRMRCPNGAVLYYAELAALDLPLHRRLGALVNYVRYALHAGRPVRQLVAQGPWPLLVAVVLPAGLVAASRDRVRVRPGPSRAG